MKKLVYLFAVVAIMLSFSSCGSRNTPRSVAKRYVNNIVKGDFDKTKDMLSDEIPEAVKVSLVRVLETKVSYSPKIKSFKFIEETISEYGYYADVTFEILLCTGEIYYTIIVLTLVDDKWMIDSSGFMI